MGVHTSHCSWDTKAFTLEKNMRIQSKLARIIQQHNLEISTLYSDAQFVTCELGGLTLLIKDGKYRVRVCMEDCERYLLDCGARDIKIHYMFLPM